MIKEGYIQLPRSFFDHFSWDETRVFSKVEAFLDLQQLAAFAPTERLVKGILIELSVGDIVASERFLELRWNWSRTKVRTFLALLEKNHDITRRKDHRNTVITLDKHWVSALWGDEKKPPKKPLTRPVENQRRTSGEPNIRRGSNSKELKNKQAEELRQIFPKKVSKKDDIPKIEAALKVMPFDKLKPLVEAYQKLRAGEDKKYTPSAARWFGKEMWESDELQDFISSGFRKIETSNAQAQVKREIEPPKEMLREAYELTWSKEEFPLVADWSDAMTFWGFCDDDRFALKQASETLNNFFKS